MRRHNRIPSWQEYRVAFEQIARSITPKNLQMLRAHYQRPKHQITAGQLARAVGYPNHGSANLHYGRLSQRLCEHLGWKSPCHVTVLATDEYPTGKTTLQLTMRPQVVKALESLGWVGNGKLSDARTPIPSRGWSGSRISNLWVYKCNRKEQPFANAYGDWADVFHHKGPMRWGGSWCTRNPVSKRIFNDLIRPGDLILAYQTDDRAIVGVCRVKRVTGPYGDRKLVLEALHQFPIPIPIHDLKAQSSELRTVAAFSGDIPQTIYGVSPRERAILERLCGLNLTVRPAEPVLEARRLRGAGAGFGSVESNRKVERAAIRLAEKWYRMRSWRVTTVEATRCGYDLRCERNGAVEHVEVKGIAGCEQKFIMTAGEWSQAEINKRFVLFVVTNAISGRPKAERISGQELVRRFRCKPIQYLVFTD